MSKGGSIIPVERIHKSILLIRGHKIVLDRDLAGLYEVETKQINQAVSRNRERFPDDFIFRLTTQEKQKVVTNCDHLNILKYSPSLPYAFRSKRTQSKKENQKR